MSAPTVSVTMDDVKGELGHFLGYGRGLPLGETAWTTAQTNDIEASVQASMALVCEPLLPDGTTYSWSWLRPFVTLTLDSGKDTLVLPEDFAGFEGPIFVTGSSATRWHPIDITNEANLEYLHATQPDTTGPPRIACEVRLKETSPHSGQRSRLRVHPKADAAYNLRVSYRYAPDVLTGGHRYPPGGALAGELFVAAAAAIAELKIDDARGVRWQYFTERLLAAVANDRRRKAQKMCYNGDPGMDRMTGHGVQEWNRRFGGGPALSVNGVVYD